MGGYDIGKMYQQTLLSNRHSTSHSGHKAKNFGNQQVKCSLISMPFNIVFISGIPETIALGSRKWTMPAEKRIKLIGKKIHAKYFAAG